MSRVEVKRSRDEEFQISHGLMSRGEEKRSCAV